MSARFFLVFLFAATATTVLAAPGPRFTLAPPPHEKPPPPWKRFDLRAPSNGIPLAPQRIASGVLSFAVQGNIRIALGLCMPRSISTSDLDVLCQSGFMGQGYHAVLESKSGTEVVVICEEEPLLIAGKEIRGRVAVTLAWIERDKYQATGIHIGEAAAFKPILECFYDAHPARRPQQR